MNLKHFKQILLVLFLLSGFTYAQLPEKKLDELINKISKDAPVYLYSYVTDNGDDGLHLAYSFDGIYWRMLNEGNSYLKSPLGKEKRMIDPSIYRDSKGVFHLVWSTGINDKFIGYASSTDLKTWSDPKEIPVMMNDIVGMNSWAPEVFFDKGKFYLVWASTVAASGQAEAASSNRLYYTTTKDFVTFSKTALFFDPGFDCVDPFAFKQKSKYYLFVKKESPIATEKTIHTTVSSKLAAFPTTVSAAISSVGQSANPAVLTIGKYTYLYWRDTNTNRLMGMRCKKLKKPEWEDVSDMLRYPAGFKPGTAFEIDNAILTGLQLK